MQQVPVLVHGVDGKPLHHGVVERHYGRLRAIIQMYVLHKQEDRPCMCLSVTYTPTIRCGAYIDCSVQSPTHTHQPSVVPMHDHVQHLIQHQSNIPCQEIKFGDLSEVLRAKKNTITYDEFEYDCTSIRRIAPLSVIHQFRPSVHSHHGPNR